jgi:transposase
VVIGTDGKRLLSRRVASDEPELIGLISDVTAVADEMTWAVDLPDSGAALLTGLLAGGNQALPYIPGRAVHRASGGWRSESKTDARDAADQARMRRDLAPLRPEDEITNELKLLTGRRTDLAVDRTRVVSRLRSILASISPALKRLAGLPPAGPLVLPPGYQAPAAVGTAGLEAWPRERRVPNADKLAAAATAAAVRQYTALRVEGLAAPVITSLPGIGVLPGAEFLAATGSGMTFFTIPGRLAAFAGLAPAPWNSGRIRGNLRQPKRYHSRLNRVFCYSAMISITRCLQSRRYYDRKRAEGKKHTQAVLTLARRRLKVMWALLRDNRPSQATPPLAAA